MEKEIEKFINMLKSFVTICETKLFHFQSKYTDHYQIGKDCFEQGEIPLSEISKHNTEHYIIVFHLFQTIEVINEIISSLQLENRKSVIPASWWSYPLGYWYGTRRYKIYDIYDMYPEAFVTLYPIKCMYVIIKQCLEERLSLIQDNPGSHYTTELRCLFASRIWNICYTKYRMLDPNAVYYYIAEDVKFKCYVDGKITNKKSGYDLG